MRANDTTLKKMSSSRFVTLTKDTVSFLYLGFANSDVHFVEGDQPTMYGNGPG